MLTQHIHMHSCAQHSHNTHSVHYTPVATIHCISWVLWCMPCVLLSSDGEGPATIICLPLPRRQILVRGGVRVLFPLGSYILTSLNWCYAEAWGEQQYLDISKIQIVKALINHGRWVLQLINRPTHFTNTHATWSNSCLRSSRWHIFVCRGGYQCMFITNRKTFNYVL